MVSNFHNSSFDDATLLKLEIYRSYIESWLPVFITRPAHSSWNGRINIFDFFCGPGKDKNGKEGSPLIALRECLKYTTHLANNGRVIKLHFNDAKPTKIKQLDQLLENYPLPHSIQYEVTSHEFTKAFMLKLKEMTGAANLIFMDQCGIKEVSPRVFKALIGLRGTDFLFFIASSFFRRFRNSTEFKKYLDATGHIDADTPYEDSHRIIASMYRSLIPSATEYYIAPFSLKKGANIYGLIYGSGNLLGIHKFLEICWKIDPERGEANFDIDGDQLPQAGDNLKLFQSNTTASKVTNFQDEIQGRLLAGQFDSDKAIFTFALENGFLPVKHAKEAVLQLIKEGKLRCQGQPRLSRICIKEPRTITLC